MTILSIDQILSHLSRNYPAKANLYSVQIYGKNNDSADPEIMVNCSTLNTPGKNLAFGQQKKYTIGPTFNFANNRSFTEINLSFYESEYEKEYQFFTEWQDKIFNKETNRFGFYDDYTKTMIMSQYNRQGELTYQCKILECWPSNISPLDRAYSNDGVSQFNVSLQFFNVVDIFKK